MENKGPDNKKIYDDNWLQWHDMKVHGPASRWLRAMVKDMTRYMNSTKIKKILDLGCGEGTTTIELAEYYPDAAVKGCDFSKTGIDFASSYYKKDNLGFVLDTENTTLNERYNLITAFEVLEHVEHWQPLLERMAKASDHYLLLSFPTGRMRAFEVNVGHYRNFKKGEVETFLAIQGFEPVKLFYAGFPFYSPFYRELCNLTNSGSNSFTKGKYGFSQKLIGNIIFFFFRHLSTRNNLGDQFCGLFRKVKVS